MSVERFTASLTQAVPFQRRKSPSAADEIVTSPKSLIEPIVTVDPATAEYTPTLTELAEGAAEKSSVTVAVVVASQRTSMTSYGLAALRATTTTSLVPKE